MRALSSVRGLSVLPRMVRAHLPEGGIKFPHVRVLVAPVRVIASDQRDSAFCVDANGWPAVRAVPAVPAVRQVFQRGDVALQEWIFGVRSERFFKFVDHCVFYG